MGPYVERAGVRLARVTRQLWAPWRLEYIMQADEQPGCVFCDGVLKPHVVFFGENVPKPRVLSCYQAVSDVAALGGALLVVSQFTLYGDAVVIGSHTIVVDDRPVLAKPV